MWYQAKPTASFDEKHAALTEENKSLRERCNTLMQAQNSLISEFEPLESMAFKLTEENQFLYIWLKEEQKNSAEVAKSLEHLKARLLKNQEDDKLRQKRRGCSNNWFGKKNKIGLAESFYRLP